MLAAKLIALTLTLLTALTKAAIDHKWRDRRTVVHRRMRFALVASIVVSGLVTAVLIVADDRTSARLLSQLDAIRRTSETEAAKAADRENTAVAHSARVESELASLQGALAPFQELASARYPTDSARAALSKLATDVASLQKRATRLESATSQIATQDVFRPLDEAHRSQVRSQVSQVRTEFLHQDATVKLACEAGNRNRQLVCQELAEILRFAHFVVEGPASRTSYSNNALPPLGVATHPADQLFADSLMRALGPFIGAEFKGTVSDKWTRGLVEIRIYGLPVFSPDGSLQLR